MPFTEKRLAGPRGDFGGYAYVFYTVPSQITTILKQLIVTNTTGSSATFSIYITTQGNYLFYNTPVSANDTLVINMSQVMTSGESLYVTCDPQYALVFTLSGVENNGPLDPATVYIADGAITTSRLANASVTSAKLAANSVGTTAIVDSSITTDKLAANAVATVDIASNAVTQAKLSTDVPLSGMRNFIINGSMSIAQRNTSFTTYNAYTLDRWYVGSSANVNVYQWRNSSDNTPNSYYSMYCQATATQQIFVYQAIESMNAIRLAGKTVTLSAYAKGISSTTNLNMNLQFSTSFDRGVTSSWTSITPTSGGDLTLSSTMTRFSAVFEVPIAARSLRVQFVNNAANFSNGQGFILGDVQLEEGAQVTPFEQRPIGLELQMCKRYFESSFRAEQPIGHGSGNFRPIPTNSLGCSGNSYFTLPLTVQKRTTTPTLRLYDYGAAHTTSENWWRYITACNAGTAVGPNVGIAIAADDMVISGYLQSSTGAAVFFDWTVDAEL